MSKNLHTTLRLSAITMLALLIRLAAWYWEPVISRDGTTYIELAEIWITTGYYPETSYLPLLPGLMKLFHTWGIPLYWGGLTINLILGAGLPLIVYGLIRQFSPREELAYAGALLMCFNPPMVDLAINIQRDTPYLFLCGSFMYCALKGYNSSRGCWLLGAGFFWGAAILMRYEALEFLPLLPLAVVALPVFKLRSWRQCGVGALLLVASLGVTLTLLTAAMGVKNQLQQAYFERFNTVLNLKH